MISYRYLTASHFIPLYITNRLLSPHIPAIKISPRSTTTSPFFSHAFPPYPSVHLFWKVKFSLEVLTLRFPGRQKKKQQKNSWWSDRVRLISEGLRILRRRKRFTWLENFILFFSFKGILKVYWRVGWLARFDSANPTFTSILPPPSFLYIWHTSSGKVNWKNKMKQTRQVYKGSQEENAKKKKHASSC